MSIFSPGEAALSSNVRLKMIDRMYKKFMGSFFQ
jgi:hypothetical protein